jgi:hypothetical protein
VFSSLVARFECVRSLVDIMIPQLSTETEVPPVLNVQSPSTRKSCATRGVRSRGSSDQPCPVPAYTPYTCHWQCTTVVPLRPVVRTRTLWHHWHRLPHSGTVTARFASHSGSHWRQHDGEQQSWQPISAFPQRRQIKTAERELGLNKSEGVREFSYAIVERMSSRRLRALCAPLALIR